MAGAAALGRTDRVPALDGLRCGDDKRQRGALLRKGACGGAGGPAGKSLWGLLLAWLGGPWLVPAGANLVLCAFNLLPVRPLDGGRALELLVSWAAGPAAGERAARWSGIAAALLSTAALWAVMDRSGGSLWLLPAAGGMLAAAMREFWGGALKKHYF